MPGQDLDALQQEEHNNTVLWKSANNSLSKLLNKTPPSRAPEVAHRQRMFYCRHRPLSYDSETSSSSSPLLSPFMAVLSISGTFHFLHIPSAASLITPCPLSSSPWWRCCVRALCASQADFELSRSFWPSLPALAPANAHTYLLSRARQRDASLSRKQLEISGGILRIL